jgi:hypothetical protein
MSILDTRHPIVQDDCTCKTTSEIYATGKLTCENLYNLAQSQAENKEDLLRAVLIFACSAIDSVGKQLTKDCLKELIDMDEGAQKTFEQYISRQIDKDPKKILARALSNPDYRGELIKVLQESIERTSLQTYAQISELTARFGIATDTIIPRTNADKIFDVRQKIIHEMDIELLATTGSTAQRRQRAESELKDLTEQILEAVCKLIEAVHNKIHEPRAELST